MGVADKRNNELINDSIKDYRKSTDIQKLKDKGINEDDILKLRLLGIHTLEALVRMPKKDWPNLEGLSHSKIDRMIKEASNSLFFGFQPASAILLQQEAKILISTGSRSLDAILEGGIET